jgi:hypothetical protein
VSCATVPMRSIGIIIFKPDYFWIILDFYVIFEKQNHERRIPVRGGGLAQYWAILDEISLKSRRFGPCSQATTGWLWALRRGRAPFSSPAPPARRRQCQLDGTHGSSSLPPRSFFILLGSETLLSMLLLVVSRSSLHTI